MRDFVLRDDDISYWTNPEELDAQYSELFKAGLKISFAVIPWSIRSFFVGNGQYFFQEPNTESDISGNKSLVLWLQEKLRGNQIELMLHGYNHKYKFMVEGCSEIYEASAAKLTPFREQGKKIEFIAEYFCHDYVDIYKKTLQGKEHLAKVFSTRISSFVPPSNSITPIALRAVANCGLDISGIYTKIRALGFSNFKLILSRMYYLCLPVCYPHVVRLKSHCELVAHSLTPTACFDDICKNLDFCSKHGAPLQLAVHYWELNEDLQQKLRQLVSMAKTSGYNFVRLKDVFGRA